MKIRFLGAARTVTGSCFLLRGNGRSILVDCGMFQGRGADDMNRREFDFMASDIDCLFLTHSHIDHVGRVPLLVRNGFRGNITATSATADIATLMLYDSARIQEYDAEWHNRKAMRSGAEPVEPLYTTADVDMTLPLIRKKEYGTVEELCEGIRFRFLDAGHILGSSVLEMWFRDGGAERKIVFSGDIGKPDSPIVNDPEFVSEADYLTVESTYGNRLHKDLDESIRELVAIIKTTFKRGGNVIIPSFALGRTQDLLYILNRLVREGRLPKIKVFIDSPLAAEITQVYARHPEYFDEEARRLFDLEDTRRMTIKFTVKPSESMKLNRVRKKAVIIASSGMCEGGRIRHHLKHNLWRRECSIVFVGYQAEGTLGRELVDGEKSVQILGEDIAVRAEVHTLGGFSAHADRNQLLNWIGQFRKCPDVFVVHGEEATSLEMKKAIEENFRCAARVPSLGEEFDI